MGNLISVFIHLSMTNYSVFKFKSVFSFHFVKIFPLLDTIIRIANVNGLII